MESENPEIKSKQAPKRDFASKNIAKINVKHMNLISGIVDTKVILELEVNDNEFDELEWALVQAHLYEMGLWDMSKCQA